MTEIKMSALSSRSEGEGLEEEGLQKKKKARPSIASVRKAFIRGRVTQRPLTFKVDNDNYEKLLGVKNKGRLINELLRNYFEDTDDLPL